MVLNNEILAIVGDSANNYIKTGRSRENAIHQGVGVAINSASSTARQGSMAGTGAIRQTEVYTGYSKTVGNALDAAVILKVAANRIMYEQVKGDYRKFLNEHGGELKKAHEEGPAVGKNVKVHEQGEVKEHTCIKTLKNGKEIKYTVKEVGTPTTETQTEKVRIRQNAADDYTFGKVSKNEDGSVKLDKKGEAKESRFFNKKAFKLRQTTTSEQSRATFAKDGASKSFLSRHRQTKQLEKALKVADRREANKYNYTSASSKEKEGKYKEKWEKAKQIEDPDKRFKKQKRIAHKIAKRADKLKKKDIKFNNKTDKQITKAQGKLKKIDDKLDKIDDSKLRGKLAKNHLLRKRDKSGTNTFISGLKTRSSVDQTSTGGLGTMSKNDMLNQIAKNKGDDIKEKMGNLKGSRKRSLKRVSGLVLKESGIMKNNEFGQGYNITNKFVTPAKAVYNTTLKKVVVKRMKQAGRSLAVNTATYAVRGVQFISNKAHHVTVKYVDKAAKSLAKDKLKETVSKKVDKVADVVSHPVKSAWNSEPVKKARATTKDVAKKGAKKAGKAAKKPVDFLAKRIAKTRMYLAAKAVLRRLGQTKIAQVARAGTGLIGKALRGIITFFKRIFEAIGKLFSTIAGLFASVGHAIGVVVFFYMMFLLLSGQMMGVATSLFGVVDGILEVFVASEPSFDYLTNDIWFYGIGPESGEGWELVKSNTAGFFKGDNPISHFVADITGSSKSYTYVDVTYNASPYIFEPETAPISEDDENYDPAKASITVSPAIRKSGGRVTGIQENDREIGSILVNFYDDYYDGIFDHFKSENRKKESLWGALIYYLYDTTHQVTKDEITYSGTRVTVNAYTHEIIKEEEVELTRVEINVQIDRGNDFYAKTKDATLALVNGILQELKASGYNKDGVDHVTAQELRQLYDAAFTKPDVWDVGEELAYPGYDINYFRIWGDSASEERYARIKSAIENARITGDPLIEYDFSNPPDNVVFVNQTGAQAAQQGVGNFDSIDYCIKGDTNVYTITSEGVISVTGDLNHITNRDEGGLYDKVMNADATSASILAGTIAQELAADPMYFAEELGIKRSKLDPYGHIPYSHDGGQDLSKGAVDCSGLVYAIYHSSLMSEYSSIYPERLRCAQIYEKAKNHAGKLALLSEVITTEHTDGKDAVIDSLRWGDLVLFKNTDSYEAAPGAWGHVGIYVGTDENGDLMMINSNGMSYSPKKYWIVGHGSLGTFDSISEAYTAAYACGYSASTIKVEELVQGVIKQRIKDRNYNGIVYVRVGGDVDNFVVGD